MKNLFLILFILDVMYPTISFANLINQPAKHAIYTKNAPLPIGAYSQAVKVNKTVYISGQIPVEIKTGELVKGDFTIHFKQALTNLNEIAKASGGNLNNLVKITIYVTDLTNVPIINKIMKESFHEPYPARAIIEIKKLAKNADVEIEAVMEM